MESTAKGKMKPRTLEPLNRAALISLLNLAHDLIFVTDMEGVIKYWNRAAEERYGWTAEQVSGKVVHDLLKTVFPAPLEQIKAELMRTGCWEGELVQTQKNGTRMVVASRWSVQRDEKAVPVAILQTNNDVTESKEALEHKRALQDSEANLNRAQEIAHIGSWHLDIVRNELTWSNEVYRMFNVPRGTALGYNTFLDLVHPKDREHLHRAWTAALEGAPYDIEHRILVGDELKWVRERAELEFDEQGKAVKGIGTVQDITERKRAEEALRRTGAYLADAQRLTHTGTWAGDSTHRPQYWSEEMFRIFGFDPEQGFPTLEQALQRLHPEDVDKVRQAYAKMVEEKVDYYSEFRLVFPDGTVKHVQALNHPILNPDGELVEALGTVVDITERKRAEEALRESEAYLAEAQRLSHTGSWAFDLTSHKYLYASEECLEIFEVDARQGLPTREAIFRQIQPEDWDRVNIDFEKSVREKIDTKSEFRIVCPSGTVKHIETIRHPVMNDAGEVVRLVGTVIDVTERKRAEEALRRSERYLAETQRLAHTGTFAADCTTAPVYWSEEMFRIFGFDSQDGLPSSDQLFERIHPEDLDKVKQAWARGITEKVSGDLEYRIVLPGGTVKYVYGLGHPVLNDRGEVIEVLGTTVDITERKHAEEERERLRRLEADLRHLNRVSMMGELAASVAHEVNQPISGIVSNASACLRWLSGDVPNMEEARETVRRIVRDGKRAGEIIARIRAMATRRAAARKEELDLNKTIQEILALVRDEAKKKSVVTQTQFADDLSTVSGDRVQLQQVVLNLVMNAIEAMTSVEGRARELIITTRNIDAGQVQATVQDSGTGLDPNSIEKLFDPFYTTKSGGMGMGLSISRSIVQAHGGRLWAAANDGPGAVFHFTLPRYHSAPTTKV